MSDDITLPPEMLPRRKGATVVVQCPCGAEWNPRFFDVCPVCKDPAPKPRGPVN